jgi:hypothetical protein
MYKNILGNSIMVEINDIRTEFKGVTFSKFKKTDVTKELLNSLIQSKIEPACYWSAELVCAGHYSDLWEIIILFYSKYVHTGNPKIAIYLELRINNFKELIQSGFINNELRMRNNPKIRRMFCEIMCVLCDAKRSHSFDNIKAIKGDIVLKASSKEFVVLKPDDPQELFAAANELAYCLSLKHTIDACQWIEWIIEYNRLKPSKCERRAYNVDSKMQMDVVWIIWDIFMAENQKQPPLVQKVVHSLLTLFTLKYTSGCAKKRKYLLYFVVSVLCETLSSTEEIMRDKTVVSNVLQNIDLVYEQIKKNEQSPGTDYLFKDVKTYNLEKTIEKLEQMNILGEKFVPRTSV